MLRQFAASVAITLMLTGAAVAGPLEDADAAYRSGNYPTALRLWQALAVLGDAEAEYNLGLMHGIGEGVPQDLAEAAKWFQLAADQGHAEAQYNLGLAYHDGAGLSQDYAEAARWFRMAAEQGHARAQSSLGLMYAKGEGAWPDYVLAHMWLNLSATRGLEGAETNRDIIANLMTPDQLAEAQRLAREWKPAAER